MQDATLNNRNPGVLEQLASDLPGGLAAPARRAVIGAGVWRLEQLAAFSEGELKKLHGIGPNAMRQLQQALESRGMGFRGYTDPTGFEMYPVWHTESDRSEN